MPKRHTQTKLMCNNNAVDPFGSNFAASVAYKQVERLVTATHMVTNYVPKDENLRERVRDIASSLLSDTLKLRDGFAGVGKGTIGNVIAQVRLLLSLLDTLYAAGLISEMNLRVLKGAYKDFVQNLSAMATGSLSDAVTLTSEYFSQADTTEGSAVAAPRLQESASSVEPRQPRSRASLPRSGSTAAAPSKSSGAATHNRPSSINSDRTTTIIELVTKRGSVSVGDIAQLITGCSSKTLQRDLAKLVAAKALTRAGSKRWTRYSLA